MRRYPPQFLTILSIPGDKSFFRFDLTIEQRGRRDPTTPAENFELRAEALWRELVDTHGESLLRVAYRVLCNLHDAEDVVQQVLTEALAMEKVPDIRILKRMAAFRSIDRLRRRNDVISFDETMHVASGSEPRQEIEVREQAHLLRRAICQLPDRQAQCFWLRHVEGLSNQEIAENQSISITAVSTALSKARRTLRDSLSKEQRLSHERTS